jgi:hypothetical protein
MHTDIPLNSPVLFGRPGACVFALLALLGASLGGAQMLRAQAPSTAAPAHKAAHPRKHPAAAPAPVPAPPATPVPATPPAPEVPLWPANEKPALATVTWDSQGLRIDAANSSLVQILKEVATVTGAKVEGLDADQRIFGAYGPGPARDVLSQLLLGSGYNVVMIGDQGQGTPREVVLSPPHSGGAQPAVNPAPASDEDADTEEPPQQNQPPIRPPFGPGGMPRTPQQMLEFQQRQQQMMQQQRQQQGPPPPPNNPPN